MNAELSPSSNSKVIAVSKVVSSRYEPGTRPVSWDERVTGEEVVVSDEGDEITLVSNGGQSSPAPGWLLLLEQQDNSSYSWTLYGLK